LSRTDEGGRDPKFNVRYQDESSQKQTASRQPHLILSLSLQKKMSLIIEEKDLEKFIMVGDRVLVKPKNPLQKTNSGLILPPSVQENEMILSGYVVRVGPGYPIPVMADDDEPWKAKAEAVKYVPLQARVGDLAVYLNKSGYEIEFNMEKYFVLPHSAILMLIRDETLFE
jgi:chaperonin GroES